MILSDYTIYEEIEQGRLVIDPFDEKFLQPAGYDIRIGTEFLSYLAGATNPVIDPFAKNADDVLHYERTVCNKSHPFYHIYPGAFVLGTSLEKFKLPEDVVAFIDGKASLGRIGLLTGIASTNIAPGFSGALTLELANLANRPIKLCPGMPIAHLTFMRTDRPVRNPYGSEGKGHHYYGQPGVSPANFHRFG